MDAKAIGLLITKLRKKCGLTQLQLAEKLNISDSRSVSNAIYRIRKKLKSILLEKN